MTRNLERFSASARMAFLLAAANANTIEERHLLGAIYLEKAGVAGRALRLMGVTSEHIAVALMQLPLEKTDYKPLQPVTLGISAKSLLSQAVKEARSLRHAYVGTGHILLASLRQHDGLIHAILNSVFMTETEAVTVVTRLIGVDTNPRDRHSNSRDRSNAVYSQTFFGRISRLIPSIGEKETRKALLTEEKLRQNRLLRLYRIEDLPYLAPITTRWFTFIIRSMLVGQRWDEIIALCTRAIAENVDVARAYRIRGLAYGMKKDEAHALADLDEALRINPELIEALYDRGLKLFNKKEYDQAIGEFNKIINLKPGFSDAYVTRGAAYLRQNDLDHAIADFNEAIRINHASFYGHYNRARTQIALKNFDAAIADASRVISFNRQNPAGYLLRGDAFAAASRPASAIADFDSAIRLNPKGANAYGKRASVHFQENQLSLAIQDCTQALRLNPRLASAYHLRGTARADQKDFARAEENFRAHMRLCPQNSYSHSNYAWLNLLTGNLDIALDYVEEALRINAQNGMAYYTRGTIHAQHGNIKAAVADYQLALKHWTNIHTKHSEHYFQEMQAYIDKWQSKE